jgi:hypothetical protein
MPTRHSAPRTSWQAPSHRSRDPTPQPHAADRPQLSVWHVELEHRDPHGVVPLEAERFAGGNKILDIASAAPGWGATSNTRTAQTRETSVRPIGVLKGNEGAVQRRSVVGGRRCSRNRRGPIESAQVKRCGACGGLCVTHGNGKAVDPCGVGGVSGSTREDLCMSTLQSASFRRGASIRLFDAARRRPLSNSVSGHRTKQGPGADGDPPRDSTAECDSPRAVPNLGSANPRRDGAQAGQKRQRRRRHPENLTRRH